MGRSNLNPCDRKADKEQAAGWLRDEQQLPQEAGWSMCLYPKFGTQGERWVRPNPVSLPNRGLRGLQSGAPFLSTL